MTHGVILTPMAALPDSLPSVLAVAMTGTPNAAFLQAVAEIQSYAQQLAGTPAAGEPQVNAVLLTAKANASQWYDTIFPTYLELPQAIAADGTTIDDGLGLLSRLSGQLEAGSSAALLGQVDQQAASLATTIEALQNQVSGLAGSLQTFHDRVSGDTTALQEAAGVANTACFALQIELSALYGKLNSLKSATCPSASDIQACAQQLAQTQDALTAARSDLQTATAASRLLAGPRRARPTSQLLGLGGRGRGQRAGGARAHPVRSGQRGRR